MPTFGSTGGDLVDQAREWIDRLRERVAGRGPGGQPHSEQRRPVGRRSGALRTQQAVPAGAGKTMPSGRPARRARNRTDRAARGAYTLILGAVLVVLVIALFFAVRWVLDPGSPSPSASATPAPSATPLSGPVAQSSPPPAFPPPSPSPSPSPVSLPAPTQRFHVVEGGDTLNRIAQRYGVTVEAVMQANGITDRNRILRIGERLIVPEPGAAGPSGVPPR